VAQHNTRTGGGRRPGRLSRLHPGLKIGGLRAVVALLVAGLGLVAIFTAVQAVGSEAAVSRATVQVTDVASTTSAVLADLADAETGQRGYLLTQKQAYLQPYRRGVADLSGQLARLRALVAETPGGPLASAEITRLADTKLSELTRTIELAGQNRYGDALVLVSAGLGKRTMDQLRGQLTGLARTSASLAATEQDRGRRSQHLAEFGALTSVLFMLLLLARTMFSRRAERTARWLSEQRFQMAFDQAPIGMALIGLTDQDAGKFLQVNQKLSSITGYSPGELLGKTVKSLLSAEEHPSAAISLALTSQGADPPPHAERRWVCADGSIIWLMSSVTVIRDASGSPRHCVCQFLDVTARREIEGRLAHLALHDALTGLPNRLLLMDHLTEALRRAERHRDLVAVLFLDLDDFKVVNDSMGHDAGDELLICAAERVRKCLRTTDTAARLGGDEFVIVCEELHDPAAAELMSLRLQEAFSNPLTVRGHPVQVTASIGVAISSDAATSAQELLRQADTAMYVAKRSGKARYALAEPEQEVRALRHLTLDAELRLAVQRQEFRLQYQPVLDLTTGQMRSVEALLRWQHPKRGLLYPGDFLDVAEEQDLILPIGQWVLETACQDAAGWQNRFGTSAPDVAVNIASRQLGKQELNQQVATALRSSGLAAERLTLEVTERQIVSSAHSVQADLISIADQNVRLSLDDFGTGFSTFDYLRRFPFNVLKIDRTFVTGLGRNPTDAAIASALIAVGKSLGLDIIAEGVETEMQRRLLETLGCHLAQGFLFCQSISGDSISELLKAPGDNMLVS
jgi:diguanylate cyclase (GGDEF)-like protein/PAS domain S-box-containing protein